ncbi:hypothetical protein HN358_00325 [Candidatus Uhrbacteria bacterium]|nr:hypothetical protein [Candidatus Uhrbacteria bacterium]MBT7717712.1 hypothetical protein [Candidatus Uhrbacteria bacterium]
MKSSTKNEQPRRILIIGDAGRGKTTFAQHASEKFGIPMFSLDDILWKQRYSEIEDRPKAMQRIQEVVERDAWIIEGATRYLAEQSFERADIIYHFQHRSIVGQILHLVWRYLKKRGSTFVELCKLILHSIYKRYSVGYCRHESGWCEILDPHDNKVIHIRSKRDVNDLIETLLSPPAV